MSTHLTTTFADAVCTVTLHPPEGKPPTLDPTVMDAFDRVLDEVETRAGDLSAVVLQSASPKFFCAGANLNVLETINHHTIGHRMNRRTGRRRPIQQAVKDKVAQVVGTGRMRGFVVGAHLGMSSACHVRRQGTAVMMHFMLAALRDTRNQP